METVNLLAKVQQPGWDLSLTHAGLVVSAPTRTEAEKLIDEALYQICQKKSYLKRIKLE